MKRPNLILLIIGLLLLIPVSIGITKTIEFEKTKAIASYLYEGKVLMNQQDYTSFKSILAHDDVNILELNAYSSDSPLVLFRVIVPKDTPFPWGKQTVAYYEYTSPTQQSFYLGVFVIVLGIVAWVFLITSFTIRTGTIDKGVVDEQ